MVKRIVSSLIGLPLVIALLIWGNKYLFDAVVSGVAIIGLFEYFNSFDKSNKIINLRWIAYFAALVLAFIHVIPEEYIFTVLIAIIPVSFLVLFIQLIVTETKYTVKDIAIVLFGICYLVIFLSFLSMLRETEKGRVLIFAIFAIAWGTDVFAYFIGRKFGKHKFTKISPNKSIEGCIAGIFGAILFMIVFTIISNNVTDYQFNYFVAIVIAAVLSIISQIGDLAASSIKRFTKIKDFGNLIPGHGGILDRLDSVIFIAPFAYFLLTLI